MTRAVPAICLCAFLSACASRPPAPPPSPAPTVPLPPPPPSGEPADLYGLSARDLREVFGAPTFTRKENGTEMWRYDGTNCRAFFFLYVQGDGRFVRHVETVPQGVRMAADSNCLTALRSRPPAS